MLGTQTLCAGPCSGRTIRSLKWFFILSCGLLLLIAAGLVSSGVVFFTSAGLFGVTFPYEVRTPPLKHRLVVTLACPPLNPPFRPATVPGRALVQPHPVGHLGLLQHVHQRVLVARARAVWLHGCVGWWF